MSPSELSEFIKNTARRLGFSKVGITPAESDPLDNQRLTQWLENDYHATMVWMESCADERGDIQNYFPGAKSVISVAINYFTGTADSSSTSGNISNYAWGDDYHDIIMPKLYTLLREIQANTQDVKGVACVDTSPIMEKAWAQRAGLGWIGKHTNLLTRDFGSWLFLGELILDLPLNYDSPFIEDLCGSCTACLDACPTDAFPEPYLLDSTRCISYLTIEHRGDFENIEDMGQTGWIYGCDICQEVCPWNIKFSQFTEQNEFKPRLDFQKRKLTDWNKLTEEEFRKLFKNSAVKRTKYKGLKRNIDFQLNSFGSREK